MPSYTGSLSDSRGYTGYYCSSLSSEAGFFKLTIHNPTDPKYTTWSCESVSGNTMSGYPLTKTTGVHKSAVQISGIKIYPMSSTNGFDFSSRFSLYGYRRNGKYL